MKYIDAEKLIHDLEERIFAYSEGYAEGDDRRKDAIETLLKDVRYQCSLQQEQPEVNLEKFISDFIDKKDSENQGRWYEEDIIEAMKSSFALGLNARKV